MPPVVPAPGPAHQHFRPSLLAPQVPSPFKPTIRSIDSVENFDAIWTGLPPTVGRRAAGWRQCVACGDAPPLPLPARCLPGLHPPIPSRFLNPLHLLQDSPCASPREASLQDHHFEGFTYCSESFLAVAAKQDSDLPHMDKISE